MQVLTDHSRDVALTIRKQMIVALSTLVESQPEVVAESWVKGVLPAVLDPETKVQEKVIEVGTNLFFFLL